MVGELRKKTKKKYRIRRSREYPNIWLVQRYYGLPGVWVTTAHRRTWSECIEHLIGLGW